MPYLNPAPFDIDGYVSEWSKEKPIEAQHEARAGIVSSLHELSRPFLAQGYNAAAAVNRGISAFSSHLDSISDYVAASTGTEKGNLFEDAAKLYEDNADYWKKRADKVGMTFIDEIISEATGGFIPGVSQFVLDVASGFTFPYMAGAAEAYNRDEDPFIGGMLEAGKTGTLAALFRMIGPLKQYLRAPIMGTVFGMQEAEQAQEGEKMKAFAKGAGIGAMYSLSSPGGQLGLNEVAEGMRPLTKAFVEKMKSEEGSVEIGNGPLVESAPQKRQRKFLKTVEESGLTEPELSEAVGKVEPQDYTVQPNQESLSKAETRLKTEGIDKTIDYVLSDADLNAEKGATFITLMNEFQKAGDFDRAVQMVEAYDTQLREAGRFVQAASLWSNASPQAFIRWANKQLKAVESNYGWGDVLFNRKPESFTLSKEEQKFIMQKYREMDAMPEGIDKTDSMLEIIDMVAKKVPPSVSELIDAYRYQNMLSSPKTHMRNIGENIFNTFIARPVDLTTRGAIDHIKAGLTGAEREAYIKDAPVYLKTALNAVPNAVRGFMETMKLTRTADIGKPDIGIEAKTEFQKARTKQLPTALTVVSRFMEACDKFNMALIGASEMAVGKQRGLSDADAYRNATNAAEELLYRKDLDPSDPKLSYPAKLLTSLGVLMQKSRKLPGLRTISKWYVPFLRTPINKGIQMIERSALSAIRKPGTFDEDVAAKLISAGVVTALGGIMAYEGQTTWAAPSDPEEKKLFYASGRKPFALRMGNKWIPMWYLGPFALSFGIPAAIKHYTEDTKQSMTDGATDKILNIANGVSRFIGSQSSTQSIGALFSALSGDIDFKFSSQTGFTVQQIIPGASFIRYVNTIIDPIYRKPTGFIESIEANLPILSKQLDAYQTPLFEDAERETVNYFLPYDVGTSEPEYEAMFPLVRYEARQKSIENKLEAYLKNVRDGKKDAVEGLEEFMNIVMQGELKSLELLGEEISNE